MDEQTRQLERVRWLRAWTRADRAPDTFHSYWSQVQKYMDWCSEQGLETSSLDSADLYLDHLQRSTTLHMTRYAGKALKAYGKYIADEYQEPSPFARLKLPPEPAVQHAPTATADDLTKLLEACTPSRAVSAAPWEPLRDQALLVLMAGTGMRRGEIANMTLDDLNLIDGEVRIPKSKTKTPRTVHLPETSVGALMRYLRAVAKDRPKGEQHVWLGSQNRAPISSNGIGQMVYRRGKQAGVDVSAHSFRRMYAGAWLKGGGAETLLMQQAGWKSTAMISRYGKATMQENSLAEAKRLFA